jgi:hypothetical protein
MIIYQYNDYNIIGEIENKITEINEILERQNRLEIDFELFE